MGVIADTLQAKKRLVEAGFSDVKAEGIVAIFNEADAQVATKLDLELFRKDIRGEILGLRDEMKAGDVSLRDEMKAGDASLRDEMKAGDASLRDELKQLELRLLKAQFAGVVTTVVIILAALKFFV